jgi:hypothetical protein
MAKPTTRQELKDYALRQLGYPVLEINVADEQVDDALDDSLQLFQERHFDGVERVLLKYKITENDIKRGRARGGGNTLGITTSSTGDGGTVTISGDSNWDDVIVRHTFDDDFTDYSPVGNTPTLGGTPDIVASPIKFGKSGRFTTSENLYYGHNAAYDFTGEWTFETWIYIDSSPSGGALFSKSNGTYASEIFGLLVDNQGGIINFRWQNTDNSLHNSSFGTGLGSYTTGQIIQNWVHVAVTRRASDGSIHFFLNGTESTSTSSNQVIDNNIPNNSLRYLYLNRREKYLDSRSTDAIYDDVRITAKERYTSNFTVPTSAFPTDGTLTTSVGGEVQSFEENTNFLNLPDAIIGVEKLYLFDASFIANNMFSFKYQLFLNDVAFNLGYSGLLSYAMTKTYLEDIDFLLTANKQIRYNKRNNRLYLDVDWGSISAGTYIIIDCQRIMDPANYAGVYNDSFLKKYFTSLVKRQWGQNLIKFQGVKLPGGVELNGRQIYEDAVMELQRIEDKMLSTYEIPPLDLIG